MVSRAEIDWSQNLESRRVADHAVGISRRPLDVDNNRIERIFRVDLSRERPLDPLVLSDGTKAGLAKGWGLRVGDVDLRDPRICKRRGAEKSTAHQCKNDCRAMREVVQR